MNLGQERNWVFFATNGNHDKEEQLAASILNNRKESLPVNIRPNNRVRIQISQILQHAGPNLFLDFFNAAVY